MHKAILASTLAIFLGVFPLLDSAYSQTATSGQASPTANSTSSASLSLVPIADGKAQASLLPFETVATGNHSDDLDVQVAMMKDPKAVGKYFDGLLWRKHFVPFYVSIRNKGNYPIEVSMGNVLLLEEKLPDRKVADKLAQLSATTPSTGTKQSSKKKSKKDLPPFVPPTPPGYVFQKSKHIQYGWKSNLGMLALTGASLGFLAPLTVPSMVVGNMYRGTNKKLVNNFQDLSLGRVTIEPGEVAESWLFYRRDSKRQALLPKKLVFADIYVPKVEELSSFLIDYQPLASKQVGIRRSMDESEVRDLQLFQGKIVEEQKEQQATDKMKDLETLGSSSPQKDSKENTDAAKKY